MQNGCHFEKKTNCIYDATAYSSLLVPDKIYFQFIF